MTKLKAVLLCNLLNLQLLSVLEFLYKHISAGKFHLHQKFDKTPETSRSGFALCGILIFVKCALIIVLRNGGEI